jgi:hypothetical protein
MPCFMIPVLSAISHVSARRRGTAMYKYDEGPGKDVGFHVSGAALFISRTRT